VYTEFVEIELEGKCKSNIAWTSAI